MMHLLCYGVVKLPNLKLKTRPKQLLGSLLLDITLPGGISTLLKNISPVRKKLARDKHSSLFFGIVSDELGDQIGRFFNIWVLFTWVFFKFYLNKQFQNTVCCTYFNIQKHFDATIFDFQFELL